MYEYAELADYHRRVSQGIVHTPEYQERMRREKERFDAAQRTEFEEYAARNGCVVEPLAGGGLMSVPAELFSIAQCRHYADGRRVWCPPMCPRQSTPKPATARKQRKWLRQHRKDRCSLTGGAYERDV